MFSVLRMIVIVVMAVASYGVTATAEGQTQDRWGADVVLEAMPDTSFRDRTRLPQTRYRTPFIIPISPPDFGNIPRPTMAFEGPRTTIDRPTRPRQENFLALEVPIETAVPRVPSVAETVATLRPVPWASELVARAHTQSRVVSVAVPNQRRLGHRIAEFSLNVEATEDQLRARETWTLRELEAMLDQLEALHASRQLLQLYWNLLDATDQWSVGRIHSLADSIELFRQRLFETNVALDVRPEAVSLLDRSTAQSRLRELGRKLDAMGRQDDE